MDHWDAPPEERYLGLKPAQFNLAFFAIVGAVAVAAAVYFGAFGALVGSSGGDGSSSASTVAEKATPTPEGETDAAPTMTAEEAANSAVLKLSDMPSGWTKDAPDADDEDDDFEYTDECAVLNEETFPGELASAESAEFEGPEGQQASSGASTFADEAVANEAFDTLVSAFSLCGDQFVAAFQQGMIGEGERDGLVVGQAEVSLKELAFPELGDSSIAYRLAGSFSLEDVPFEFTVDFVFVQAGRMAGGLSYMAFFGVNSLEEEVLAETVAQKLAEANASLAE